MKRYFSRRIFVVLALLVFFTVPSAFAATLTIEALNVTDRDLGGFIMNFEGITDASFAKGDAISSWFGAVTPNKLVAGVTQLEAVDLLGGSPMVDGLIGTLTYVGTIGWSSVQFPNGYEFRTESNEIDSLMTVTGNLADGSTLTSQPVPIPSAILLLGGGLISLIAVRRRRSLA